MVPQDFADAQTLAEHSFTVFEIGPTRVAGKSDTMVFTTLATLRLETDAPNTLGCKFVSHNTAILVPLRRSGDTMKTIIWNFERGFAYRCALRWRCRKNWNLVRLGHAYGAIWTLTFNSSQTSTYDMLKGVSFYLRQSWMLSTFFTSPGARLPLKLSNAALPRRQRGLTLYSTARPHLNQLYCSWKTRSIPVSLHRFRPRDSSI